MKRFFLIVALFFSSLACFADNAGTKIAVIDMDILFKDYYKTQIVEQRLKKQQEAYQGWAKKLAQARMKLKKSFEKLRDESLNIVLDETERERKKALATEQYTLMREKEAEIREYTAEKQKSINADFEKARAEILNEIRAEVAKIAIAEKIDIVLDKSGRTLNNIPSIVYFNESLNITSKVLNNLNSTQHKPASKETIKK
ncbi:OmpH family outer membrane protein [Lentisphaerota bacterium WC36G]|nr:OmpH family outer membrane protein [Lentisphaerae bacterium WC36]